MVGELYDCAGRIASGRSAVLIKHRVGKQDELDVQRRDRRERSSNPGAGVRRGAHAIDQSRTGGLPENRFVSLW